MKKTLPITLGLVLTAFAVFAPNKAVSKFVVGEGTRYIVELKEKPTLTNDKKTEAEIFGSQDSIIKSIQNFSELDSNLNVIDRYSAAFNGFAMNLTEDDVAFVKGLSSVKAVYKVKDHKLNIASADSVYATASQTHTNYSLKTMNRPDVTNAGKDVLVAVLDSSFFIQQRGGASVNAHEAYEDNLASEGVSVTKYTESYFTTKKASTGFIGKNAKRLNNKVPYYYDYGGGTAGLNDTDVFDTASTHGTHVSTSIAGKSSTYEGVAPYAQLALMKVAKDGGGASDDNILEAIDDAAKLGADIITMSMGSDNYDFTDFSESGSAFNSVMDTLTESGVIFDVAAGNNGKQNYQYTDGYAYNAPSFSQTGTTGSYANDPRTFAVANATNDTYIASALEFNGNYYDYTDPSDTDKTKKLPALSTLSGKDLSYVMIPNVGTEDDYKDIDVSGKVAVIARGDTTFYAKIHIAQTHGAIGAIIYNNVVTDTSVSMSLTGTDGDITIPSAFVSKRALNDIVAGVSKPMHVMVNSVIDNVFKRRVSASSSDGSNSQLAITPEIATPGTAVTAGVFVKNATGAYISGYEDMTGTSMAAPNFAGSLALLLSQGISKDQLLMRTMSTANPMIDYNGEYYSPRRQGAGLIDITAALNTKQYLEGSDSRGLVSSLQKNVVKRSKIELGFSLDGEFDLKFKVYNDSTSSVNYKPSVSIMIPKTIDTTEVTDEYGNTSTAEVDGTTYQTTYDKTLRKFDADVINVEGSSSKNVTIHLSLTSEEKALINSIFKTSSKAVGTYVEGYVELAPTDDSVAEKLNIPYMGFYGDFAGNASVEPFDFEREDGQIYQSDLVNRLVKQSSDDSSLGLSANFNSQWVVSGNSTGAIDDVIKNKKTLSALGTPIGYDASKGKVVNENNEFYVGATGYSDVMYIQQFVLGSVATNSVKFVNSSGETVIDDHMFDALYSGMWNDADDKETINSYRLDRSMVSLDFYPASDKEYYTATRAYTIIPLYPFKKVPTGTEGKEDWVRDGSYPDGQYKMTFDYLSEAAVDFGLSTVADPTYTQHMEYTLHLDSVKPTLDSMEIVNKNGEEYLRVFGEDETALMYISVGGMYSSSIETDEATGKTYADFKTSLFSSDKMTAIASDKAGNKINSAFYLSDVVDAKHTYSFSDTQAVISNAIDPTVTATLTSVDVSALEKEYTITFYKNGSKFETEESYRLVFRVGTSSSTDITLVNGFYEDANGKLVQVDVSMNNGKIYINIPSGDYTKVIFVDFNSLSGLFDGTYELAGMNTIITKVGTEYHFGD